MDPRHPDHRGERGCPGGDLFSRGAGVTFPVPAPGCARYAGFGGDSQYDRLLL
jgi:hypothetical protein